VQIGCLGLRDFRNYEALSYRPTGRLNVLSGRNAQGKTNLQEAIEEVLTGRLFSTSRLAEQRAWGDQAALLTGDLIRTEGTRNVRAALRRLEGGT